MKIEVPRTIRVGSMNATISMTAHMRSDDGYKGTYNQRTNAMQIDNQSTGDSRNRTFLHEVVHMIDLDKECGLNEETIARVANGVSELLCALGIELDWEEIEQMEGE